MALIAPEKERAAALAYVFLGWSLAIAIGLPLITLFATQFGWRETFLAIGILAGMGALLNAAALPGGLQGHRLSLSSFVGHCPQPHAAADPADHACSRCPGSSRSRSIWRRWCQKLTDAGPAAAGLLFSLLGIAGVDRQPRRRPEWCNLAGVRRTLGFFILVMMAGALVFALGDRRAGADGRGYIFLGLGITAGNSMQQARLDHGSAGARERDGRAQHFVSVCRAGNRLRQRRASSVPARIVPDDRIRIAVACFGDAISWCLCCPSADVHSASAGSLMPD
jgi:DHA1 family inner membrane transport protein